MRIIVIFIATLFAFSAIAQEKRPKLTKKEVLQFANKALQKSARDPQAFKNARVYWDDNESLWFVMYDAGKNYLFIDVDDETGRTNLKIQQN